MQHDSDQGGPGASPLAPAGSGADLERASRRAVSESRESIRALGASGPAAGGALVAAVDLGGTKILAAVAGADGRWLGSDERPSEPERGPEAVLARMLDALGAALTQASAVMGDLGAIGVATPGPIDFPRGLVLQAPNLPGWRDVPLARLLAERAGCPALLENDANAAALGEHRFGAGQGVRNLVYLTVSTGIGGGLILDGRLYRGAGGAAGELGHIVIQRDGPLCGCGARGCLEMYASGRAIGLRALAAVRRGDAPVIARLAAGGAVTAEHVAAAAQDGDAVAAMLIREAGEALGLGLSDFVNVFNPEVIVIGGGAAQIGAALLGPAEAVMRARAFPGPAGQVRLLPAALGGRSAAVGALALALDMAAEPEPRA